jgi:hypothetical protein|uniref:Uncharacterized protein n=1 Tax=Eutreptiella gymnastica TaxID=73025 RepID=A0A7S4GI14_9EUGL|mmetsp:Transcript_60804/g.100503  ORF Transcript_60804/g.100503 Transcript_60804/m.100503 type:complete len:114 (-) Transcript_60804:333-674(-)
MAAIERVEQQQLSQVQACINQPYFFYLDEEQQAVLHAVLKLAHSVNAFVDVFNLLFSLEPCVAFYSISSLDSVAIKLLFALCAWPSPAHQCLTITRPVHKLVCCNNSFEVILT